MTKNKQILNNIKDENTKLGEAIRGVYLDANNGCLEEKSDHQLNGAHLPLLRKLKRFAKRLGAKASNKPSVLEAVRLLSLKENTKAIEMLTHLAEQDQPQAYYQLGRVYSNGVKNKVGIVEFYDPRKALINLLKARDNDVLEAGYLLGILYVKYGKYNEAKQVFFINHRKGCMRSSTELLLIFQAELNQVGHESKEARIIKTYIQSIKTDINNENHTS